MSQAVLKGKRLLILGANPETAAIVQVAKKMGVFTIVTDYNPHAPAKPIADKSYDIDCMDVDAICAMAKNEEIDGVMVGVADTLLKPYQEICDRLSMACYGTAQQMSILSTKDLFKRECRKYGIEGVPVYEHDQDFSSVQYPVIVKPVDNCSGKGMSICYHADDLASGIAKATTSSISGRYIIERYMTCDDLIAYYTIQNGIASLSMLGDRYTYRESLECSPVCLADIYPSRHLEVFLTQEDNKFKQMLSDLGVKNGVFLVQMFFENNTCYVYDPGFRLQGGAQHLNIAAIQGFDQREMLVEFALTGIMGNESIEKIDDVRLRGKTAGSLWILLKPGTISSIEGMDEFASDKEVVNVLQRFKAGDTITQEMQGTEQQVFARLHVVSMSRERYKQKIRDLMQRIKVLDQADNDMILWGDFSADNLSDFPEVG